LLPLATIITTIAVAVVVIIVHLARASTRYALIPKIILGGIYENKQVREKIVS